MWRSLWVLFWRSGGRGEKLLGWGDGLTEWAGGLEAWALRILADR